MKIRAVCDWLRNEFPIELQEHYDNSGLQIGEIDLEVKNVLVSLDCTEAIVDEAISKNCNLIISHHPLLFVGLKQIGNHTSIEKIVRKCIKNDITLFTTDVKTVPNSVLCLGNAGARWIDLSERPENKDSANAYINKAIEKLNQNESPRLVAFRRTSSPNQLKHRGRF